MHAFLWIPLVCLLPTHLPAGDADAKAVAQDVLNKGAALFDARDSAILADTWTEDGRLFWVERDRDTGKYKTLVKEGRPEIERFYRDFFKDSREKTTSRNTVEFARYVAPDLMVIHGEFAPDTSKDGKYTFVQERVKVGDKWLIQALRLYVVSGD